MALSRREFAARVGLIREIEPLTDQAYKFSQWLAQQAPDKGVDHADPWHLSFHGSQFPGDNPYACGRQAIYRMMDIPRSVFSRKSMQVMDAGKDIENRLVQKWYDAGYLLSAPPTERYQTQFQDSNVWLTSTVDAIVVHPGSNRPMVVEIKTKYAADIELMLRLCKGPDPAHVNQVKAQIGLANEQGQWEVRRCYNSGRLPVNIGADSNGNAVTVCPEHGSAKCLRAEVLEPVEYGYIYYVSRDNPVDTWEFYYENDPIFMAAGRKMLAIWRQHFEEGKLPQTNFDSKRFSHPFNWAWTRSQKHPNSPCEWCDYGDVCRSDHRRAIELQQPIELKDSSAVEIAREVRPQYDLDLVRAAVLRRWSVDNLIAEPS